MIEKKKSAIQKARTHTKAFQQSMTIDQFWSRLNLKPPTHTSILNKLRISGVQPKTRARICMQHEQR